MLATEPTNSGGCIEPFSVKDCALVALATGKKARTLQEFRSEFERIEVASIYHHFWGGLLQPRFEEREFNNDFASWMGHSIHDLTLAERLAAVSPTEFTDLAALRREILDLIDARLDEAEHLLWTPATRQFEFVCSQIVVFDTEQRLHEPEDLAGAAASFSTSSIFYHFIDARRRTDSGRDDFSDWLAAFGPGFEALRKQLAGIDPYFGNLSELRDELARSFMSYFGGSSP
jgi:Family of unknown function (DUF5752)